MEKQLFHINELCVKVTDGSHFSPVESVDGNYPMFSVKDMEYNGFSYENCKYIDLETYKVLERNDCRPLKNDILIAKDGSYLKCVFKVKEDMDACILSSIAILRPNVKVIDPDFFVYLLRTKSIKSAMASYVSGSALPRIILSDFKKMKLNLFENINYQKQISNTLIKYDTLIENNNNRIKLLENIAEELYKEWFVRFRFPGCEKNEINDKIPQKWSIKRLGEISKIFTGKTDVQDAVDDGEYPLFDRSYTIKRSNKFLFDCEALLIPGEGTSFIPRYFNGKFDLHQRCYCVSPKHEFLGKFLYFYLKQHRAYFLNVATGATVPSLRYKNFDRMKILMPDIELLKKFDLIVNSMFEEINRLNTINKNLIKQRDSLLPRLMSGKLSVEGKEII